MIRCLPVSSYMWAMSFCTWILFVLVLISFSGLHSCVEILQGGCLGVEICVLNICFG